MVRSRAGCVCLENSWHRDTPRTGTGTGTRLVALPNMQQIMGNEVSHSIRERNVSPWPYCGGAGEALMVLAFTGCLAAFRQIS